MPTHLQKDISVYSLTFDGYSTVLALVDNSQDVLMWSVNGTFVGQLQILLHNLHNLVMTYCLAVDSANHTMYVGLATRGKMDVNVFILTYESPNLASLH